MKKSLKLLSAVLILALFIGSAVECCKGRSRLCCHKYETGSDLATYCNNHRNAVVKYIESAEGEAEKKVRFDNFKQFYNTAKSCTTVECIETQIAENTSMVFKSGTIRNASSLSRRPTSTPT